MLKQRHVTVIMHKSSFRLWLRSYCSKLFASLKLQNQLSIFLQR